MRAVALSLAAQAAPAAAQLDPATLALRVVSKMVQQPYDSAFWAWSYGPAICMSAMYEISKTFGTNWTPALDRRLAAFTSNSSQPAYMFLHGEMPPWNDAIGDVNGLMPIAYLSRMDYYNESASNASNSDWALAVTVADDWIMRWPLRLPDGTFSRSAGWPGQPPVNASFLWCDDQFMGLTLISRLALHGAPNALSYVDAGADMQISFAGYMQDEGTGLFYHGYSFATNETSCCFWGRANGWVMMAHVEVLTALTAVLPNDPRIQVIAGILNKHAAGLARVQDSLGLWHQVLNESSTYLETSVTAMTVYAMATAVLHGWMDRATYDPVIQNAWSALGTTVAADGTVSGICAGTGIMTSVAEYDARPTDYAACQPGLGSVFRAALAYYAYMQA